MTRTVLPKISIFFLACPEKKCQAAIVHAHCDKRSKLPQRIEPVSPPSGKESSSGGMALRADLGRYFVTMPFSMLMLFLCFLYSQVVVFNASLGPLANVKSATRH